MNYKKMGLFLGAAFVLYFVAQQPTESVGLVGDALGAVQVAAHKLADFVRSIVR